MTNIKDIYCIDISVLNAKIKEYEDISNSFTEENSSVYDVDIEGFVADELKRLKDQLKPITPLIEDTFDNGYNRGFDSASGEYDIISLSKKDYINTKQF